LVQFLASSDQLIAVELLYGDRSIGRQSRKCPDECRLVEISIDMCERYLVGRPVGDSDDLVLDAFTQVSRFRFPVSGQSVRVPFDFRPSNGTDFLREYPRLCQLFEVGQ